MNVRIGACPAMEAGRVVASRCVAQGRRGRYARTRTILAIASIASGSSATPVLPQMSLQYPTILSPNHQSDGQAL